MDTNVKNTIGLLIRLLSETPQKNSPFETWIPNCIECLQFALDNEQLLIDKPSLYEDALSTIYLLREWIFEDSKYAYLILERKFRKVCTAEEVGNAFKILNKRMQDEANKKVDNNDFISFTDESGNFKSTSQILSELSSKWDSLS